MSWRVALMWGTVIVAVVLAVIAATYFLFQSFVSSDESGNHGSGSGCLQNLSYRLYWPVSTLSGLV